MVFSGNLLKMIVRHETPVEYTLPIGDHLLPINPLIGKKIKLQFDGKINCIACGRETKKSFQQGYCFPCTRKLAQCDFCILKPVLCHYHNGTCREPEWGEQHCMIPHVVYLANTSGLKIGITRKSQVPTRWIDQGAVAAIPVFQTTTRRIAGIIEHALTENLSDRTNWRNMIKNIITPIDLLQERSRINETSKDLIQDLTHQFGDACVTYMEDSAISEFAYPVISYPKKIISLSLDKQPATVEGYLQGIKGQYLLLDTGVINIRKYTGYWVNLTVENI